MAVPGQYISCAQYGSLLLTQTPHFDQEILKDIRPATSDMMGYYKSGSYDAFTSASHTFDRFRSVQPDTTRPWNALTDTACAGRPCDPEENVIGWGSDRAQYGPYRQSWATDLLCWDEMILKTRAKEHVRQILDDILRPASKKIMGSYIGRVAAENAGRKLVAAAGLPSFTFTWDAGGYVFLNTTADPTSMLTPNMLRSQVKRNYAVGAIEANKDGFNKLQLHTDIDTYFSLSKEDPYLKALWRFQDFDTANKMYWKYGFKGEVGDFLVKALMWPMRFNKIANGRYQQVLPYKNTAATVGIGDNYNQDYDNAQFQFSYINHPLALEIQPFRGASVNPEMPFLVRDFGGKWQFAMDNLGADRNGRAIDNTRRNKGKMFSDFQIATKPSHPEFLTLFFHMVDRPCITLVSVCNTYPGYPAQTYNDDNAECACASEINLVAEANLNGQYNIAANTILVNGAAITHTAIVANSVADLVTALAARWSTASLDGTWAVVDAAARTIKISWTPAQVPAESIDIPFLYT